MTEIKEQQACHKWLSTRGSRDTFLGRRDQQPEMAQALAALRDRLERLETDFSSRLTRLLEEVGHDFERQAKVIDEVHAVLETIFESLKESSHNPATNLRASKNIDQQIQLLSRRMRPRLLHALNRLSPDYKILEKPLHELESLRLNAIKPVPDYFWSLRAKDREIDAAGKTLFEIVVEPQADVFCRSSSLLSLRYQRLKWHCRRAYRFFHLPVGEIVFESLIDRSELNTQQIIQAHKTLHTELNEQLAAIWQSIRFNLETGASELDRIAEDLRSGKTLDLVNRNDDIATMLMTALDKAVPMLEEVLARYTDFATSATASLHEDHARALAEIDQDIQNPGKLSVYLRWRRHSLKRNLSNWFAARRDLIRHAVSNPGESSSQAGILGGWYLAIVNRFRKQMPAKESLLKLTDIPSEAELIEQARVLPPIYRRLFQNTPLQNREFLLGMDSELGLLAETYARWNEGKAASVAVIGPEGSGKTSLLNCFANDLDDESVLLRTTIHHRLVSAADVIGMIEDLLGVEEVSQSPAELVSKIMNMKRQIVFVEDGHQLFLRVVGAREALETLLYILMSTRMQLFWVVTFRLNPWLRMSYLHQAERYFTHVIKTEFHSEDELRAALLLRQRTTGQAPYFRADESPSYKIGKLLNQHGEAAAEVQQVLADVYFNNIYALSGGNMQTALYYWLRSLSVDEDGKVVVSPCVKVDTGFIKNLDTPYLLTLAEVLAHGGMTPREHGEIFRQDELRSRLILDYLRQIRLLKGASLDRRGQPQSYIVNPIFYQPVSSALTSMHYLY